MLSIFNSKSKNALGTVRINTGGFMAVKGGLTLAYVEDDVEILFETAESYRVEYSSKFKRKHPDLCESNVISKDDKDRSVTYTRFTATDETPTAAGVKRAQLTISVLIPMQGGFGFGEEKADILIVEETETHYRLRFAAAFAKEHPNLCREWLRKDSNPKIEFIK